MDRAIASGRLMFLGYRVAEDRVVAALADAGFGDITRAQVRLLAGIDLAGTRLVVLAERARTPKQTALALVNGLESAGYVERVPDPSDGRARLVRLTDRGRRVVPVAVAEEARIEADWTARLGRRRMQQVRDALGELATDPGPAPSARPGIRRSPSVDAS